MQIRDRIVALRRIPARELRPNPKNWRTHSAAQQDALRGLLAEIGYAGALLARELADGSLELIDGHLRAETTPDAPVPVLVLDLTDDEADKLLATHDALCSMAGINRAALDALLPNVNTNNAAVQEMLEQISAKAKAAERFEHQRNQPPPKIELPQLYQLVVECRDESDQRELYERLIGDGYKCKVLTL